MLNKTKNTYISKESLFFYLKFRTLLIADLPNLNTLSKSKENMVKYEKIMDIIRKLFKEYEIYDDFLVQFNEISTGYIRYRDELLEAIVKKFQFYNKFEAISHLETMLRLSDPNETNMIDYMQFKEILKNTYDISIDNDEIQMSLLGLVNRDGEIDYMAMIKALNQKLEIEYYNLQYLVLEALCIANEKNRGFLRKKQFSSLFESKNLFDYNEFRNNMLIFKKNVDLNLPLLFSAIYYENNFLKMNDFLKKRVNLNKTEENQINCHNIDFSDFYNKNKLFERFEEILNFLDFISNITNDFIQPAKKSTNNSIERSESSLNSKKSKKKSLFKRGTVLMNVSNSPSPRKSVAFTQKNNPFLGVKLILARKPFKNHQKTQKI